MTRKLLLVGLAVLLAGAGSDPAEVEAPPSEEPADAEPAATARTAAPTATGQAAGRIGIIKW